MAPHSSILVWKIPWAEEPGQLPSIGSDVTELLSTQKRSFLLLLVASGCFQSDSSTDRTTRSLCRTCDPGSRCLGHTAPKSQDSGLFSTGAVHPIPPAAASPHSPHAPHPSHTCPDRCMVIPAPGVSCLLTTTEVENVSVSGRLCHLPLFSGEVSAQIFCQFIGLFGWIFLFSSKTGLSIQDTSPVPELTFANIFLPLCGLFCSVS